MHEIKKQHLKINSLSKIQEENHELSLEQPWIQELLNELQEGCEDSTNGTLSGAIKIARKMDHGLLKDHIIITGHIQGKYQAACIRCLEPTPCEFSTEFESCFVSESLENEPEFAETSHVFAQGQEMELYFYEKCQIDLKELIHENIYLVVEPLPLHDSECLGLCPECGTNLNNETCKHQ